MRRPSCARITASSTSGMSVTQTGQPGPMITLSPRGKRVRRPNLAIACSWLPHTCITETGARPISVHSRSSARANPRAFAGSRNLSSFAPRVSVSSIGGLPAGRRDLAAHIGGHHVALGFLEEQLVQRQRLLDLARRDLPDREAHVVQDVVAGLHRLVHDVEPRLAADAPEIHRGRLSVNGDDATGHAEAHQILTDLSWDFTN